MTEIGPFDLGVEEEYQVVSPETWELRSTIHAILARDMEDGVEDVRAEFLQSQVEAVTRICNTVQELRDELVRMRGQAAQIAESLDLALVAAGTHPFSSWLDQQVTRGDRYAALAQELQEVGRRLVTCGLHVHVGVADLDLRIALLNRFRPYLSLLLALSTSSPFCEARFTGLRSYRTVLLRALPRTGIPPHFDTWTEYHALVKSLQAQNLLTDPSTIWWDARLSARFPTLEVRAVDMPTRLDDAVCLAAWVQALALKLARDPAAPDLHPLVLETNKWHAVRYGCAARLLLRPDEPARPVRAWIEQLLGELGGVADELDSHAELAHARVILETGTSADRQLSIWQTTGDMRAVVADLARATMEGAARPQNDGRREAT